MIRCLVDAQLPRRLALALQHTGLDVVHTLDLPLGNATPDSDIIAASLEQERVVITKDADFVQSFLLHGRPHKLLLVSTGNITNDELLALFEMRRVELVDLLASSSFVEMTRDLLIVHV